MAENMVQPHLCHLFQWDICEKVKTGGLLCSSPASQQEGKWSFWRQMVRLKPDMFGALQQRSRHTGTPNVKEPSLKFKPFVRSDGLMFLSRLYKCHCWYWDVEYVCLSDNDNWELMCVCRWRCFGDKNLLCDACALLCHGGQKCNLEQNSRDFFCP